VWKKSGGENRKPENSISVESQLKLMPIAAIDRIMHTDMREILSRSIGEEMAMKFEKMLKQATTIKKLHTIIVQRNNFNISNMCCDNR
jgi:histone H3/H4